jgi:phosphoribosylaminoimidazolecarboxamide formyltransferase / IMP cyclohydrolase
MVGTPFLDIKSLVDGGLIIQASFRNRILTEEDFLPAETTKDGTTFLARKPSTREADDLLFAWAVEAGVTSNSIIFARDGATVSIGTGEQDRVGCVELTIQKAYTKYADKLAFERHGLSLYELKQKATARPGVGRIPGRDPGPDRKGQGRVARHGARLGRLLPLPRRRGPGHCPGRDRHRPARRLHPRLGIIQAVNEAAPQVAMVFTGQRSFKH